MRPGVQNIAGATVVAALALVGRMLPSGDAGVLIRQAAQAVADGSRAVLLSVCRSATNLVVSLLLWILRTIYEIVSTAVLVIAERTGASTLIDASTELVASTVRVASSSGDGLAAAVYAQVRSAALASLPTILALLVIAIIVAVARWRWRRARHLIRARQFVSQQGFLSFPLKVPCAPLSLAPLFETSLNGSPDANHSVPPLVVRTAAASAAIEALEAFRERMRFVASSAVSAPDAVSPVECHAVVSTYYGLAAEASASYDLLALPSTELSRRGIDLAWSAAFGGGDAVASMPFGAIAGRLADALSPLPADSRASEWRFELACATFNLAAALSALGISQPPEAAFQSY